MNGVLEGGRAVRATGPRLNEDPFSAWGRDSGDGGDRRPAGRRRLAPIPAPTLPASVPPPGSPSPRPGAARPGDDGDGDPAPGGGRPGHGLGYLRVLAVAGHAAPTTTPARGPGFDRLRHRRHPHRPVPGGRTAGVGVAR